MKSFWSQHKVYLVLKSFWYHAVMDIQKTALRLPKDLHQMVIAAAEQTGHSMNAEIISRLRNSFEQREADVLTKEDVRKIVQEELRKS